MPAESKTSSAMSYALSAAVAKKSLTIALIVGCLLSIANQGDVLFTQPVTTRIGIKIFLNFLIPFIVSSVSAVLNRPGK
ncbi:MAG: hypothetical protein EXQ56_06035 [Acidobacteria bacterium]|nr:hypothetical protein [Acidobacteriota bacterium]